jgi:hypothetical protein
MVSQGSHSKKDPELVANSGKSVSNSTVPYHIASAELSTAVADVVVRVVLWTTASRDRSPERKRSDDAPRNQCVDKLAKASDGCAEKAVSQTNFLDHVAKGAGYFGTFFNAILMTPPRRQNEDVRHLMAAWDCLAPGGTLVAVLSPGWEHPANESELLLFRRWF